jgi:hypothetical protein
VLSLIAPALIVQALTLERPGLRKAWTNPRVLDVVDEFF